MDKEEDREKKMSERYTKTLKSRKDSPWLHEHFMQSLHAYFFRGTLLAIARKRP